MVQEVINSSQAMLTSASEFHKMGYTEVPNLDDFPSYDDSTDDIHDRNQSEVDRKSAASTPPASPGPANDESLIDQLSTIKSAQLAKMLMDLAGKYAQSAACLN